MFPGQAAVSTTEARMNRPPPFRAEHVGSLLRPAPLTAAFRAWSAGEIDDAGFRRVQDECIRDVAALQEEVGLRVVTDGEFRRASYWGHFLGPVAGLGTAEAVYRFRDEAGAESTFLAPRVEGPVRRGESIGGPAFSFLTGVTRATPKVTMPSPPTFHFWRGRATFSPGTYEDPAEFFSELATVYREELADLAARGARYIQLDDVPLVMLCDPDIRARLADEGEDADALVDLYLASINDALSERPPGMVVGLHLCRGNHRGKHLSSGGYEPVAERLFNELDIDAYFLEYDGERAGGFEPLRLLPEGKRAVLGLVSTKSAALESVSGLASRLDEASRHTPLDRLGVSPQCGFASTVGGNPISVDVQRQKLARVVAAAREVWGDEA